MTVRPSEEVREQIELCMKNLKISQGEAIEELIKIGLATINRASQNTVLKIAEGSNGSEQRVTNAMTSDTPAKDPHTQLLAHYEQIKERRRLRLEEMEEKKQFMLQLYREKKQIDIDAAREIAEIRGSTRKSDKIYGKSEINFPDKAGPVIVLDCPKKRFYDR
jgi:adenylate kinase family enzyme